MTSGRAWRVTDRESPFVAIAAIGGIVWSTAMIAERLKAAEHRNVKTLSVGMPGLDFVHFGKRTRAGARGHGASRRTATGDLIPKSRHCITHYDDTTGITNAINHRP